MLLRRGERSVRTQAESGLGKRAGAAAPAADSATEPDPGDGQRSREHLRYLARNSRTVALWVLASRITGFGRVALTAAVLGPTFFGNLVQFAAGVPGLIFSLLSGPLIAAMLVPPFVRRLDGQDQTGARRLANGFLGTVLAM